MCGRSNGSAFAQGARAMLSSVLFVAVGLISHVLGHPAHSQRSLLDTSTNITNLRFTCGNEVNQEQVLAIETMANGALNQLRLQGSDTSNNEIRSIDVAFHVISSGGEGDIPKKMIKKQVKVLNEGYKGFANFTLVSIDRTDNPSWYTVLIGSLAEKEMKETLHIGDATTLNVYTVVGNGEILGWSSFPWDFKAKSKLDGVVVHHETLPGGSMEPFNLGQTLTHEVGHWAGLWHTFQNGCDADATDGGDMVDDTPAEAFAATGCPDERDTCTGEKFTGTDPVKNFMDYTNDACMIGFTPGQFNRMQKMWALFRGT